MDKNARGIHVCLVTSFLALGVYSGVSPNVFAEEDPCDSAIESLLDELPKEIEPEGDVWDNHEILKRWEGPSDPEALESAAGDVLNECTIFETSRVDGGDEFQDSQKCTRVLGIPLKCVWAESSLQATYNWHCDFGDVDGWTCWIFDSSGGCTSLIDSGVCIIKAEFRGSVWRNEQESYFVGGAVHFPSESEEESTSSVSEACNIVTVEADGNLGSLKTDPPAEVCLDRFGNST